MVVGVQKAWSLTASSNGSADANINFAEGQSPPSLNNSARALMAAVKGWANQIGGAKTTGGSANAQTITSDSVAAIATAYAAGMAFIAKAGYTNSGEATLNVDGVGARPIKKGGGQSALAANDIVANGVYIFVYEASGDVFILLNPETGQTSAGFQPLDATLTALAALSWSSGNALLQFTAADTVSLTLTPSVSSYTASQGAANTTPTATLTNTTDNASVRVLRLDGARATPANNDSVYLSYYLSNSSGAQTQFVREQIIATNVTAGAESGQIRWKIISGGAESDVLYIQPALMAPSTNDGVALGTGSAAWSDLFLASGGVINWNNGDAVLTHSSGLLALTTGALQAQIALSTETSGTLTSASANKKILASGGITLANAVFAAQDAIVIDGNGTARTITRGASVTMYVNGTDSATATLTANGIMTVHWRTASVCILAGNVS